MENVDIGQTAFGHRHSAGANPAQEGHRHCGAAEIARWRRDLRRVAERRARRAWGECPKGGWLDVALEIAGLAALAALAALFVWLCCAASDYHFA